ncbi:MAG: T9SS type B sorting domain-containing protein [Flavobacteriaceae bacterium]|jgi:gliding motility-associated-like protein|nr:T9SS type B sorting domain-containing protein [Flavobacteriaceae bacterium]
MKRSFLLLLMFLTTVFSTQARSAVGVNTALKENISERFHNVLISKSEDYNYAMFFAPPVNDKCDGAIQLTSNPKEICDPVKKVKVNLTGATVSGISKPISPGTNTNPPTYCDPTTNIGNMNDVWYKFKATAGSHKFSTSNVVGNDRVFMVVYRTVDPITNAKFACGTATNFIGSPKSVLNCEFNFSGIQTIEIKGFVKGEEYYVRFYTSGSSNKQFDICITTPPQPIKVIPSTTQTSHENLIKNIFVQNTGGCSLVDKVRYQNGNGDIKAQSYNNFGYFENQGGEFPFEKGIVLCTSEVEFAAGPYEENRKGQNDERWTGDKDLKDAIASGGGAPTPKFRSTQVEFEFRPIKDSISFEYLFASNSYVRGCMYDCDNGASFAAWLIDPNGVGQNVALVPGVTPGTKTAISIATVRDNTKSGVTCKSVNPQFFDKYNAATGAGSIATVNFAGMTLPMKSEKVKVIPGQKYRIKLAVMDFCTNVQHNSAVFFNAGSFDIGKPSLGEDMTLEGGSALCEGETKSIGIDIDPKYYTIAWYDEDPNKPGSKPIKDASDGTYTVTKKGKYWAKLTYKDITGCESILGPVNIEYYDPIIIEREPKNLSVCKKSGSNSTFVDLNTAMVGVTYTPIKYKFFETKADAEANGAYISDIYEFTHGPNPTKEIWVRMVNTNSIDPKDPENTGCSLIKSFKVTLKDCDVPVAYLEDMHQCEVIGATDYFFDLSQYDSKAGYGVAGVVVTYHHSSQDANLGQNAITGTNAYKGTDKEIIWVRVYNTLTQKHEITSFSLYINKLPKQPGLVTPYSVCKDPLATQGNFVLKTKDNEIKESKSGYDVLYFETKAEADSGLNIGVLDKNKYKSTAKKIYYRLVSTISGCFVTGELELTFSDTVTVGGEDTFYSCGINGKAMFDLHAIGSSKTNMNANQVDYTFYRSIADANNLTNEIIASKTYINLIPYIEVLYMRVDGGGDCPLIVPVKLVVSSQPQLSQPSPIKICSDQKEVDLTSKESEALIGLVPTSINVRYYVDKDNADAGGDLGQILDPTKYVVSRGKVVYIRVDNIIEKGGCYSVEKITIEVSPLPQVQSGLKYTLCSDITKPGFAEFNLSEKIKEITSDISVKVTFYELENDAKTGTNAIDLSKPYVNKTAYAQTIWFRGENEETGCFVVGTLTLLVNEYPPFDSTKGGVVKTCTTSNNNTGIFNLEEGVRVGFIDQDIEYMFYEDYQEALTGDATLKIRNPEAYSNVKTQTPSVWLRIRSKKTGCVGIYEIKLIANKAPEAVGTLPVEKVCDNLGDPFDYRAVIDLTIHEKQLLNGVVKGHIGKVVYFKTKIDADNNKNIIANPTHHYNENVKENIYYRLIDQTTGCYIIGSFDVEVIIGLKILTTVPRMIKCTDLTLNLGQNKAQFDLTANRSVILGTIIDYNIDFKYYETESDAKDGINAIPDNLLKTYINKTATQSIWIVVKGESGCPTIVVQTLVVDPAPMPNLKPSPLYACDLGKGKAQFNLTDATFDILKGDKTIRIEYYATLLDANNKQNELKDKALTEYSSGNGFVYARVENINASSDVHCFVVVKIELVVVNLPVLGKDLVLKHCSTVTPTPLKYEFNLKAYGIELLDGRPTEDYRVSFHLTQNDADLNQDPLPDHYVNVADAKQIIFVRIASKKTTCVATAPVVLAIEKLYVAYPVTGIKPMCGDNGFATFDLTIYDKIILGNQFVDGAANNPAVVYFASEADFNANPKKPIANPKSFKNTIKDSQKIIAIVGGAGTEYCYGRTEFTITIEDRADKASIVANGSTTEAIICFDQATNTYGTVTLETGLSSTDYDFKWFNGGTSITGAPNLPYLVVSEAGTYMVTIAKKGRVNADCYSLSSNSIKVTKIVPNSIKIKGQDSTGLVGSFEENDGAVDIVIEEPKDVYDNSGTLITTYEFALNDGIFQSGRTFYNVSNGTHKVWVRGTSKVAKACPQYKEFFVLGYMKYFTPNGDGFNDTWNIPALKGHPEAVIYIFDRYGKLIKQISPMGEGWDGTFNGKPMPSTDYWFTVEYKVEGTPSRKVSHKGHFSLKR